MKRFFAFIVVLCMTAFLFGCSQEPAPAGQEENGLGDPAPIAEQMVKAALLYDLAAMDALDLMTDDQLTAILQPILQEGGMITADGSVNWDGYIFPDTISFVKGYDLEFNRAVADLELTSQAPITFTGDECAQPLAEMVETENQFRSETSAAAFQDYVDSLNITKLMLVQVDLRFTEVPVDGGPVPESSGASAATLPAATTYTGSVKVYLIPGEDGWQVVSPNVAGSFNPIQMNLRYFNLVSES